MSSNVAQVTRAVLSGAVQAQQSSYWGEVGLGSLWGQSASGHPPGEKNPASVPSSARQPQAQELFVFLTGLTKPPEQLRSPAEVVLV